jgi:hypothetical protein
MYQTDDQILPDLNLPDPTNIKVLVNARNVQLIVGPRDWQWDRKTGDMIGCGTCMDGLNLKRKQEGASGDGAQTS